MHLLSGFSDAVAVACLTCGMATVDDINPALPIVRNIP